MVFKAIEISVELSTSTLLFIPIPKAKNKVAISVKDFIYETSSDSPAPGGGSVAALSAATSAALIEMVANLTIGKKGYEEVTADMEKVKESAKEY
ncbi:MAG: cyclodeaminase/cyclohydrolase family protein, partial [Candidatus Saccharibacteria bacterium]